MTIAKLHIDIDPELDASTFSPSVKPFVERLLAYRPSNPITLDEISKTRQAAVLALLYERDGRLRVLLTTRSKSMRKHPGQVALPGGKCESTDPGPIFTAFREANEEVGMPLDSPHIHTLCLLPPFVSLYRLVVTPVVAVLTDASILQGLKPHPDEVDDIFDHPLEAFLDPTIVRGDTLSPIGGEKWPYEAELHSTSEAQWLRGSSYRMHRFRSTSTPIKGLTSDILILLAEIVFNRKPDYERFAPGQADYSTALTWVAEDFAREAKGLQTESLVPSRNSSN